MTRNFKALGLALLTVFAMSAVAVSSASAADHLFEITGGGPADVTAKKVAGTTTIFGVKTGSLEVKCNVEEFSASTVPNNAASVTVSPTYNECTAAPFGASPVHTNGCTYKLYGKTTKHVKTTVAEGEEEDAPVDIICPVNKSITITAPGCTIHVDAQTGRHGVSYHNEGSGSTDDLKVTATVDNIHYTTGGGFICSLGGLSTTGNDAFLTGKATAQGYTAHSPHGTANHVGIKIITP